MAIWTAWHPLFLSAHGVIDAMSSWSSSSMKECVKSCWTYMVCSFQFIYIRTFSPIPCIHCSLIVIVYLICLFIHSSTCLLSWLSLQQSIWECILLEIKASKWCIPTWISGCLWEFDVIWVLKDTGGRRNRVCRQVYKYSYTYKAGDMSRSLALWITLTAFSAILNLQQCKC